ncbi:hypothetical protein GGF45_003720, partial [Coemansia sp. RSA 551]
RPWHRAPISARPTIRSSIRSRHSRRTGRRRSTTATKCSWPSRCARSRTSTTFLLCMCRAARATCGRTSISTISLQSAWLCAQTTRAVLLLAH